MSTPASIAPIRVRPTAPNRGAAFWRKRKFLIVAGVLALALGYLIFVAIQNSAMYYLTADELLAKGQAVFGERVRLGGTVAPDSVRTAPGGTAVRFEVEGRQQRVPVAYTGIVPDSFKPGGEVVVEGTLTPEGTFNADVLLAKCPSKYVPSL